LSARQFLSPQTKNVHSTMNGASFGLPSGERIPRPTGVTITLDVPQYSGRHSPTTFATILLSGDAVLYTWIGVPHGLSLGGQSVSAMLLLSRSGRLYGYVLWRIEEFHGNEGGDIACSNCIAAGVGSVNRWVGVVCYGHVEIARVITSISSTNAGVCHRSEQGRRREVGGEHVASMLVRGNLEKLMLSEMSAKEYGGLH